jgi:hypothetical protein
VTTVRWNDDVLRRVADGPEVRRQVRKVAEEIASTARRIAPEQSGNYRAGIVVRDGETERSREVTGGTVVVAATNISSHVIEYGSRQTGARAPLRRAAQQVAGSNFKPLGRNE